VFDHKSFASRGKGRLSLASPGGGGGTATVLGETASWYQALAAKENTKTHALRRKRGIRDGREGHHTSLEDQRRRLREARRLGCYGGMMPVIQKEGRERGGVGKPVEVGE